MLRGSVRLVAEGLWTAEVLLDGEDELPSGPRAVRLGLPGLELVGTVVRQGVFASTFSAELVGGGGGLATLSSAGLERTLVAKFYQQVPIRIPLLDLLTAAEEVLAPSSSLAVLSSYLATWSRLAGPPSHALRELLRAACSLVPGTTWRALPDGTIWIGPLAWPEADLEHDLEEDMPSIGVMTLGIEEKGIVPPATFRQRRIREAVYRVEGPKLRLEAWS